MKKLKIILASLVLAIVVISLSSYVSAIYKKDAFTEVCFALTPTVTVANLQAEQPAAVSSVTTLGNWRNTDVPPFECNDGTRMCAICFNDQDLQSIPPSTNTPLQNALAALNAKIAQPGTLTYSHNGSIPITFNGQTVDITFYFKAQ